MNDLQFIQSLKDSCVSFYVPACELSITIKEQVQYLDESG